MKEPYDTIIIGGGLAGLINAIVLAKHHKQVLLIERKSYPFHRVCGEYVSNEVIPFLKSIESMPVHPQPAKIQKFVLTSVSGKSISMPLDLGGFGISRYYFDLFLSENAMKAGCELLTKESVEKTEFDSANGIFKVTTRGSGVFYGKTTIGAFGKRSNVDAFLNRPFFKRRSPYIGVKYHIKTEFDPETIALHNFTGGYCGISKVEGDTFNLCYLGSRQQLRKYGSIEKMEENTLLKNPHLEEIYKNSDFLFEKPVVINEFSFEKKEAVFNHILMSGDAAGLITPLCGNGMALAIHSAKICSELVHQFLEGNLSRQQLESTYTREWNKLFSFRLWAGRQIQRLFGSGKASNLAVEIGRQTPGVANYLMSKTHGSPF